MNRAFRYGESPFSCSPTSTRDTAYIVEKSPTRGGKATISMMPNTTNATTSTTKKLPRFHCSEKNHKHQSTVDAPSATTGSQRSIAVPQSLANLRSQLNYSSSSSVTSSSSSSSSLEGGNVIALHTNNDANDFAVQDRRNNNNSRNNNNNTMPRRRLHTNSFSPSVTQRQTQKHPKEQPQHYQEQQYHAQQGIFRRRAVPLHYEQRPFKQQRSMSQSPHRPRDTLRISPEQRGQQQRNTKEPSNSSTANIAMLMLPNFQDPSSSTEQVSDAPPPPPLWTEGFAKGLADSIARTPQPLGANRARRKFWSRLKPQDIIRVSSLSEDSCEDTSNTGSAYFEDEDKHEDDNGVLGCGSFSSVTRICVRGKGTKQYALKHLKQDLLPPRLSEDCLTNGSTAAFERAARELAREANLLSRFGNEHPHIINIVGWTDGGAASYAAYMRHDAFFLVLELLQEETLDDRIERWNHDDAQLRQKQTVVTNPDNPRLHFIRRKIEQLTICKQIADALSYIHSKNIVYRDLKPQNIGFAIPTKKSSSVANDGDSNNVVVKLMDFGLARELPTSGTILPKQQQQQQQQQQPARSQPPRSPNKNSKDPTFSTPFNGLFDMTGTVGTLRYMAPEVCMHRPYGLECDIYSWSIVAHEILSQTRPYEDMTPDMYQTLVCLQGVRPQNGSNGRGMPSEYTVLLTQAWRTDPSKRLRLDRIMRQLDLFLQKEKLMLEAQELLLGMPESNESPLSLSLSFAERSSTSSRSHHHRHTRGIHCGYRVRSPHYQGGKAKYGNSSSSSNGNKRSWNQYNGGNKSHNGVIFPNSTMHCYDSGGVSPSPPAYSCVSPTRPSLPSLGYTYSSSHNGTNHEGETNHYYGRNNSSENLFRREQQIHLEQSAEKAATISPDPCCYQLRQSQQQHPYRHQQHRQDPMIPHHQKQHTRKPTPNSFHSPQRPVDTSISIDNQNRGVQWNQKEQGY